jgi:hypothetical protein
MGKTETEFADDGTDPVLLDERPVDFGCDSRDRGSKKKAKVDLAKSTRTSLGTWHILQFLGYSLQQPFLFRFLG